MEKKASKYNEKDKPSWDWAHVECYLKTVESNRKSAIWNLAPSIVLTNPATESSGPNVRLYIDTEKSLQYSGQLGWNWHKSWNIPNISLRLQIKDENTGDFLLSPRNLYAQIFAVKKNGENQKSERTTLVDVGIRGESKMEMVDGQVYFSAIKFSSTTYNNEGINFNLLIVLYISEGESEKPKVLTAVVSPPIFVDSRRSARDYQQKKFSSFVEPFAYDNLEKEFIKRENKSKCETELLIRNDPDGFYNYITAPNIRHKVKHPLFLAIKFSNCVSICYNSKFADKLSVNQLLEDMQAKLLKENKAKQKNDLETATNLEEKHFLFVISNLSDSLKRKKVLESIETMQNEFIGISCGPQELPNTFVPVATLQALKKAYKEVYESLITICQNYEPEYPDDSEDQYQSQAYESSEKESVKKKEEPLRNTRNKGSAVSYKNTVLRIDKPSKSQKNYEIMLKREQVGEGQVQPPILFNRQSQQIPRINTSNPPFSNRPLGFRNVSGSSLQNNPIFDTSLLNKNFSNNLLNVEFGAGSAQHNFGLAKDAGFRSIKQQPNAFLGQSAIMQQVGISSHVSSGQLPNSVLNANGTQSNSQLQRPGQDSHSQGVNPNMPPNFSLPGINSNPYATLYQGSSFNPSGMSGWLNSVRSNNGNLFENMQQTLPDQILHKANLQRYMQSEQQQKLLEMNRSPLPSDDPNSIVCLIQQINLYKELLSQVTYQNELLSRDIHLKQQTPNSMPFGTLPELSYFSSMNMNMGGLGMQGINPLQNGLIGGPFISPDFMNSPLSLLSNLVITQANHTQIDSLDKDKQPLVSGPSQPTPLSLGTVGQHARENGQPVSGGNGGNGGKGGIESLMGIDPQEFERIKNILKEEMKREAELREGERNESSK